MGIHLKKIKSPKSVDELHGFDAFELRLGDVMRGERATMGKSLLDVEREIRIRASYIAAIENTDPNSFDTPGFIPGYVRSYARYLGLNADEAFATFCKESGFSVEQSMTAAASASTVKSDTAASLLQLRKKDPLIDTNTPFLPASESMLSEVQPGMIGSAAVLVALVSAIGFAGWVVLNEVQQVSFAPAENSPSVLANLDPLDGAGVGQADTDQTTFAGSVVATGDNIVDRGYRYEALDFPIMVARDGPISTLDPSNVGTLGPDSGKTVSGVLSEVTVVNTLPQTTEPTPSPQVVADAKPAVRVVAVRPAWIQVTAADGSILFAKTLNRGDIYEVPALEQPASLRVGESGAIYFQIADAHYGPAGPRGVVTPNLPLAVDYLMENFELANLSQDEDFSSYVVELELPSEQ